MTKPNTVPDAPRQLETRELLAGAYRQVEHTSLTHVLDVAADRFLCRRAKPEHACDAGAGDVNAPATCPICAARDPRHQAVS